MVLSHSPHVSPPLLYINLPSHLYSGSRALCEINCSTNSAVHPRATTPRHFPGSIYKSKKIRARRNTHALKIKAHLINKKVPNLHLADLLGALLSFELLELFLALRLPPCCSPYSLSYARFASSCSCFSFLVVSCPRCLLPPGMLDCLKCSYSCDVLVNFTCRQSL